MSPRKAIIITGTTLISLNVLVALVLLYRAPAFDSADTKGNSEHSTLGSTTRATSGIQADTHVSDGSTAADVPVVQPSAPTNVGHAAIGETTQTPPSELDRYDIPVYTNGTVLSVMEACREARTCTFAGKEFPGLGLFIEEIQGVRPSVGMYWILYINDTKAVKGAGASAVSPGDRISWRIEKGF